MPEQGEVDVCARCGRPIVWEFDNELDPYGFWYGQETGIEACTPGPNDEDVYHEPSSETDETDDGLDPDNLTGMDLGED